MAVLKDLVKVVTATTGTGTMTLGAADAGFRTFAAAGIADGAKVSYGIEDAGGREVGQGIYNAVAGTLTRGLIASSTGSLLNLSGAARVFITPVATDIELPDGLSNTLAHLERAPAQAFDTPAKVAAFAGRGIELLFTSSFYRVGTDVESVLTSLGGFTCTRATGGYGLKNDGTYQLFGVNVPRITDRGITVEPAATNLITRFAPTAAQVSVKDSCSDAPEAASPPIAGLQWINLNNTTINAFAYPACTSVAASTLVTLSVLVEAPDGVQPVCGASGTTANDFDFRMVGGAALTSITTRYERLSGNIWRVIQTGLSPAAGESVFAGVVRTTTQNTRALKFSGFQLEAGSLCSTPIVTTGAAATRASDWPRITGLNISGPVALFVEFEWIGGGSDVMPGTRFIVNLGTDGNNRLLLYNASGVVASYATINATVLGAVLVSGAPTGVTVKGASRLGAEGYTLVKDGIRGAVGATTGAPGLTALGIGNNGYSNGNQASAIIKSIVVIPLDRSNDQLRALTAPAATPIAEAVTSDAKLDLMARASLYGITDLSAALAFSRTGVEARFADNYYRKGLFSGAGLLALMGGSSTGGYALKADGTYQLFGPNVPRRTDLGLTSEEARTNLFPRFAPTASQLAVATNTTDTAAPALPPIAGLSWLSPNNSGGEAQARTTTSVPDATIVTFSVLVETPDGSQPVAGTGATTANDFLFMVKSAYQEGSYKYERLSGNVWRVSITGTTVVSAGTSAGVIRLASHNTRALKFSGFQLEAGASATSPIITTGAAATRTADVPEQALPATVSEGTLVFDGVLPGAIYSSPLGTIGALMNDAGNQSVNVFIGDDGSVLAGRAAVDLAFNSSLSTAAGVALAGQRVRAVISFGQSGLDYLSVNGAPAISGGSRTAGYALTRLVPGRLASNPGPLNSIVREVDFIPRRLSAAEVQALSAI